MRAVRPALVVSGAIIVGVSLTFACGETLVVTSPTTNDASSSTDVDGASSGSLVDGEADGSSSSSDAGFCAQTSDLIFCTTFNGPLPQTGWSSVNLDGDGSTLMLDPTSFISPPTSLGSSAARDDDGVATLVTQIQQDPGVPEGAPFSIDFDFRTGPLAVPNGSQARLLTINFKGAPPSRVVRLFATVQGATLKLGLRDIFNTEAVQLQLSELNQWTHMRFEARRDLTVDAGTGEPVYKVTATINGDTVNAKYMHVATSALQTLQPFDVELGVDKGGTTDRLTFNAQFDNVRILRLK
jgi:hypothetical protein